MLHFRSLLLTAMVGLAASATSCSSARYFDFTTANHSRSSAYAASATKVQTPAVAPVAATTPAATEVAVLPAGPVAEAAPANTPATAPVTASASAAAATPAAPAPRLSAQLAEARAEQHLTRAQERRYERVLQKVRTEEMRQEAAGQEINAIALILAIFIPPLGVLVHEGGQITSRFWISLVLTLLFFFPGMIYSILVVTNTI